MRAPSGFVTVASTEGRMSLLTAVIAAESCVQTPGKTGSVTVRLSPVVWAVTGRTGPNRQVPKSTSDGKNVRFPKFEIFITFFLPARSVARSEKRRVGKGGRLRGRP